VDWQRLLLAGFIALVLPLAGTARASGKPTLEYQIKASYLYNFLRYVEWPPGTLSGNTLLVCVFGKERFGTALDSIVGESVRGQVIAVRPVSEPGQLDGCRLVFVGAAERGQEDVILQQLAGRPVLTIGETPGFADRGGVINLIRVKDKIRFEINQQAAERGGLRIGSQLLQLAVRK
jgi:hypothetical protein